MAKNIAQATARSTSAPRTRTKTAKRIIGSKKAKKDRKQKGID